jgi:hypothetical protein
VRRRELVALICPTVKAEYFSREGWTGFADLPVGSFCRICLRYIVIASGAKQSIAPLAETWITSSLPLLAIR